LLAALAQMVKLNARIAPLTITAIVIPGLLMRFSPSLPHVF
jgi:hypothetical protein